MISKALGHIDRVWECLSHSARSAKAIASAGIFLALFSSFPGSVSTAQAQTIVAIVNGTPVTNVDIEQRMKLLRVLHKPAGHEEALQSVIDDNLKLDETNKFKIKASDAEIGQQIARAAANLKMDPQALVAAMHAAGVSDIHIKDHFASEHTFRVLLQALSKGIEASETEVRAELAKGGKSASGTEYVVREIVLALPAGANMEKFNGRMHEAQQLRTRFADCGSGVPLARGMDDVAVKDEIRRNGSQLSQGMREVLEKTPTGHLTEPHRSSEGVEMIAVCSKSAATDDTAARNAIAEKILSAHIDAEAQKKLEELRSHAVIVKK
jgi:peptidyl-prolyl cis-trans isomerase SurA